jgi:hypothetical protein
VAEPAGCCIPANQSGPRGSRTRSAARVCGRPHLATAPPPDRISDGTTTALGLAVTLGLIVERPGERDDAPVHREFFVDRLIIPELRDGHPIWCIGRAIEEPVTARPPVDPDGKVRRARPKYLALPGEKPVLGLEHVVGRQAVYLVEGPVDWLAGIAWGLPTFAICGTHFPADRLPALNGARAIYGLFDPDRAGQSAADGSHLCSAAAGGPCAYPTAWTWRSSLSSASTVARPSTF